MVEMEEEKKAAAMEVAAAEKPREPTPDHPPYSWMIGEAIASLSEEGGSTEASISSFIRGKYPGVPQAHDRFLQHYLTKHITEGLFVCTAPGRYSRPLDDPTLLLDMRADPAMPIVPKQDDVKASVPVKRGRGRPRKEEASAAPTSVAGKKNGSEGAPPAAMPERRGRPRKQAPVTADGIPDDPSCCVLALPATADKPGARKRGRKPKNAVAGS